MAFNEQPAWHGLGLNIAGQPARDTGMAMEAAGLAWTVEKKTLFTNQPEGFKSVPNHFAVVRSHIGDTVGVVGNHYTVLQNTDAFRFFDPIVSQGHGVIETAGSLYGGRKVWVLVRLHGDFRVKGDLVRKYALLANSHDGQSRVQYGFTPRRVCCENTLRLALSDREAFGGTRHRLNVAAAVAGASAVLSQANEAFNDAEAVFNAMAGIRLNRDKLESYFRKAYNRPASGRSDWRALDKLTRLFEAGRGNDQPSIRGTLWAAYNAVTEFEDYKPYHATEVADRRLSEVWWGIGARNKFRAFAVARRVVEGVTEL